MSCPRCGFSEAGPVECPRCGVVFAKLARRARPAPAAPAEGPPGDSGFRRSRLDAALLVALAASAAVNVSRSTREPPARRPAVVVPAREAPSPVGRAPSRQERPTPPGPPSTQAPDPIPCP